MLIDELRIVFKAGKGGDGKASFFPGKTSGPSGGNGGKGGDLIVIGDTNLSDLNHLAGKRIISAENGMPGGNNQQYGKAGEDLKIRLPLGTALTDEITGKTWEIEEDLQEIIICHGGKGGRGNASLKSSQMTTPMIFEKGEKGQEKDLKIKMRMIADFGLIGLPNAGKSSLLNELTSAGVRVGSYAFTTLEPSLGVYKGKVIADIPGLIEGASDGKGLGIDFLKHIEKVKLLLHCISVENEDVLDSYKTILNELENFNPEVANKPQIVLLTKSDLLSKEDLDKKIKTLKKINKDVLAVSVLDNQSVDLLKNYLFKVEN